MNWKLQAPVARFVCAQGSDFNDHLYADSGNPDSPNWFGRTRFGSLFAYHKYFLGFGVSKPEKGAPDVMVQWRHTPKWQKIGWLYPLPDHSLDELNFHVLVTTPERDALLAKMDLEAKEYAKELMDQVALVRNVHDTLIAYDPIPDKLHPFFFTPPAPTK